MLYWWCLKNPSLYRCPLPLRTRRSRQRWMDRKNKIKRSILYLLKLLALKSSMKGNLVLHLEKNNWLIYELKIQYISLHTCTLYTVLCQMILVTVWYNSEDIDESVLLKTILFHHKFFILLLHHSDNLLRLGLSWQRYSWAILTSFIFYSKMSYWTQKAAGFYYILVFFS